MVTSPDGMGIIIVGGGLSEKRILESRFDGSKFLPWQIMNQELQYGRYEHVVIPINLERIFLAHETTCVKSFAK